MGIAAACDQQGRKWKWIARERNEAWIDAGDASSHLLARGGDQESAYNPACPQLLCRMGHHRHAAAVCDQYDGFARIASSLDQARSPRGTIGTLPIVLLNASRRLEPRLPTRLPVIGSRVGPAWNHEDIDIN
jgi:hypothetical protein